MKELEEHSTDSVMIHVQDKSKTNETTLSELRLLAINQVSRKRLDTEEDNKS